MPAPLYARERTAVRRILKQPGEYLRIVHKVLLYHYSLAFLQGSASSGGHRAIAGLHDTVVR